MKKIIAMSLTILVFNLSLYAAAGGETKEEKDVKFAQKVKAKIAKLGTGHDAVVEVKLRDGSKVKGYISEAKNNEFVVMDSNSGDLVSIPYSQAKQVKGNNLSSGAKIAIGVGLIAATIIIILVAGKH